MDTESLHQQIEGLCHANWRVRAILHAMVEAGSLTRLECQLPDCVMDSREFDPQRSGRGHVRKGLVIDHIVPQLQGGSDRPENLRVIHANCNVARAKGWKQTPEARAAIAKAAKARGGWEKANTLRKPGWNLKLADAAVREMRAAYRAGETIQSIATRHDVGYTTAHSAITGRRSYGLVLD